MSTDEPVTDAAAIPSGYRGLDALERALGAIDGARLFRDGASVDGRPIFRLELGPNHAARVSIVLAGLHALEWIGVETALALATELAAAPLHRRVVVHPLINPDGYARGEADLRAGRRRYRRANARGVDLNRNFPTHFRSVHVRSMLLPFLGGPGPSPGSEPEIRAVLATLEREAGRIERAVSLHSIGNKLLLPFGGRWRLPDDVARLRAHAEGVQHRLPDRYDVQVAGRWGPGFFAYGMELDHLHAIGAAPILVECSQGGVTWRDPSSWIDPFRWYNPPDPERHAPAIARALVPFVAPERGSDQSGP